MGRDTGRGHREGRSAHRGSGAWLHSPSAADPLYLLLADVSNFGVLQKDNPTYKGLGRSTKWS